jgi:hypothetical protein
MSAILCIGKDPQLLGTRAALLRLTGAEVFTSDLHDAPAALDQRNFDLVLLCHSFSIDEALQMQEAVHRQFPRMQVVRLTSSRGVGSYRATGGFDAIVDVEPATLLRTVIALLANPRAPIAEYSAH